VALDPPEGDTEHEDRPEQLELRGVERRRVLEHQRMQHEEERCQQGGPRVHVPAEQPERGERGRGDDDDLQEQVPDPRRLEGREVAQGCGHAGDDRSECMHGRRVARPGDPLGVLEERLREVGGRDDLDAGIGVVLPQDGYRGRPVRGGVGVGVQPRDVGADEERHGHPGEQHPLLTSNRPISSPARTPDAPSTSPHC